MKNLTPLTVLLGGVLIAVAIYFGLTNMPSESSPPETTALQREITALQREITELKQEKDQKEDPDISPKILNMLNAHIEDIRTTLLAVDESFQGNHYQDIAMHAANMERLVQQIRQVATDLPTSDFERINIYLRELQHGMHELEEAALEQNHESAHHSYDTALRFLNLLEEDVEGL